VISLTSGVPSKQIADMGENHFTFSPEIGHLMQALAGYMRQNNFSKTGIIYVLDAFGQENYDQFKKHFEAAGGTVLIAEGVEKGGMDVRTQILKIKNVSPDSIIIMLTGGSIVSALTELEKQNLTNLPKFSIHGFQTPDVLKDGGINAEGVIYPYPANSVSTEKSKKYTEDYLAKYGQSPELYSANVHDSFTVLVRAINKCGYDDVACVKQAISATKDYDGVNGKISLDERGVVVFQSTLLRTVRDGKFEDLE
jgi:branched-chain amino acid transport system substrate-binding protein